MWRFSKSKIWRIGRQAGDPGKSCSLSAKAVSWQNSFLLSEEIAFVLLRSSVDWLRLTTFWLYSESTDLKVNLIQKSAFIETSRIIFDLISGHHAQPNWHIKLTITLLADGAGSVMFLRCLGTEKGLKTNA